MCVKLFIYHIITQSPCYVCQTIYISHYHTVSLLCVSDSPSSLTRSLSVVCVSNSPDFTHIVYHIITHSLSVVCVKLPRLHTYCLSHYHTQSPCCVCQTPQTSHILSITLSHAVSLLCVSNSPAPHTIFLLRLSNSPRSRSNGPFSRIPMKKVTSGHEIESKAGHSIDLGSLLVSRSQRVTRSKAR